MHALVLSVSLLCISAPTQRHSVYCYHLGWQSGGGSGSRRSLLWLQLQRQPVLRHSSTGTFLWHHKFLHFLWPALGGYKGHTWAVIVCLALSSVSLPLLPVTSSTPRLSDCLKILRSLRSGPRTNKSSGLFDKWQARKGLFFSQAPFYCIFVGLIEGSRPGLSERMCTWPTTTLHSPTCWYLLFVEAWGWGAEKKKIRGEKRGFFFPPFLRGREGRCPQEQERSAFIWCSAGAPWGGWNNTRTSTTTFLWVKKVKGHSTTPPCQSVPRH